MHRLTDADLITHQDGSHVEVLLQMSAFLAAVSSALHRGSVSGGSIAAEAAHLHAKPAALH